MSAFTSITLLFFLCVCCCCIVKVNGIQNLRYPLRVEHKQWRFGKRQDQLSQPRFFLWKSALAPGQLYPNTKTPVLPSSYNRYGMPPPAMAPIHQSYMFAIPTKVNYPPYQPLKEIDEKRNPGNLHHITIINAIMPKPYVPTPPTYSHPTTTFRNYRNNKLLYHQYLNNNNYGRQNMENYNKIKAQQQQLHKQQLQLQQQQHNPAVYQSFQNNLPAAAMMVNNKPTMEYINLISYTTSSNINTNNNNHENTINNTTVANCGRRAKEDDSSNTANSVLYYYCNNRILNYKNPSENYYESTHPITTTTPKSTTTSTKSSRLDLDFYSTEKSIFLPTPNTPLDSSSATVVLTTPSTVNLMEYNFVPTSPTTYEGIKLQQQRYTTKIYDDFKRQQQRHTSTTHNDMKRQQQRHTATKYTDMKRQQQQHQFTTASYDDMKLHSFFTIEDAVTSAPPMQVFNDPYQAYRHARKQHNYHQRQIATTTTTTKPPIVTTTTKKSSKFQSFFDDLEDEVYVTPDSHQYDYTFFGQPQKSANKLSTHNQLVDHTHKPEISDSFYGESFQGKPKIKEHHFGIFDAITPTTFKAPIITTTEPNEQFSEITFTTPKIYKTKPLAYSTTTEITMINKEPDTTTTTSDISHVAAPTTTTTLATTTTTEKKAKRMPTKSALNLRSTASFQFPKHRGLYKPNKTNLTTSTSSTRTPPFKKVLKYQRQYKGKQKLKQFKHLYTTTSSTTTTTTTTTPKIETYHTKRSPSRTWPTSTTEIAATTRKILSRTTPTTETTNPRKVTTRFTSTTESNNAKRPTSRSLSSTDSTNSVKKESMRRGSKRAYKLKEKEEPQKQTTKRIQNKRRRKPQTTLNTPKSTLASFPSTTTNSYILSSTPTSILSRTSSTTTTTTMKSIMRIANSKVRSQVQNDIKSNVKLSNEVYDDLLTSADRVSLNSITSSMAKDVTVPSLPIEIYFKKSHIAQL